MLQNPPAGEWPTWRRGYDGQGFSPLRQINKTNVGELRAAWSWALPNGPNESTPLFHDGVLFVHAYGDKVQAIDAATGDLLWQYSRRLPHGHARQRQARDRALRRQGLQPARPTRTSSRSTPRPAASSGTGRLRTPKQGYGLTGGVTVAKGKVIASTTGRAPGGNFIVALDAQTGREAWRFGTIPKDGELGGNTWNGVPYEKRNGGSVWVPGSYDSTTGLLVHRRRPNVRHRSVPRSRRPAHNDDLLFTDSTLAIDPDTGKLEWHFQHLSNDQWDYDWAFTRSAGQIDAGRQACSSAPAASRRSTTISKRGHGEYAFSFDLGVQNVITGVDPKTGAKQIDARSDARQRPNGHDVSPRRRREELAARFLQSRQPRVVRVAGRSVHGSDAGRARVDAAACRPACAGRCVRGRTATASTDASTPSTSRRRRPSGWRVSGRRCRPACWPLPAASSSRARIDRGFSAYDDATGKELWRTRLNDVPSSAPITLHGQRPAVHRARHRQRRRAGRDVPGARAGNQESARSRRDAVGVRATQTLTAGYRPNS